MKKIKQKLIFMLTLLMIGMAATSSVPVHAAKAVVRLNKNSVSLYEGQSYKKLKASVSGTTKKVTWRSSNPSVVSVDKDGILKARKKGTAAITASIGKLKSSCEVTVKNPTIKLNKESVMLYTNMYPKALILKATVKGASKEIKWTSSKQSVATVSYGGKVTAKKTGTTVIKATANGVSCSCKITVSVGDSFHGSTEATNDAIEITAELRNDLKYYYQTNYIKSCHGLYTCGMSSYLAAHYVLTGKKENYCEFVNEASRTNFFNGKGANWYIIAKDRKSYYSKKYRITGKKIDNAYKSVVNELKKGHPVVYMVNGTGGFRTTEYNGQHFVVLLSWRKKGGVEQVYAFNPMDGKQVSNRWMTKEEVLKYAIKRNDNPYTPYAMWATD